MDVCDLLIVTFLLFLPVLYLLLPLELFEYIHLKLEFSPSAYPISDSLVTFKSRLKSHLFSSAYHVYSHSYASASASTFDYI